MVKIGIIIDNYHFTQKVQNFLDYMKSKAEISIYLEEGYLLTRLRKEDFSENLFFVKGRGDLMIDLAKHVENETDIPIINSSRGVWLSMHRFLNSILLDKAGIKVAKFTLLPSSFSPPFENFIRKNIVDQKNYAFKPKIEKKDGKIQVSDERAIKEKENYEFYFYQEFIKSKWEYKIYGVGEDLYFYKQLPILVNPNKMETRKKIDKIPELEEVAFKAMETIDLRLSSMDFLKSKEGFYYLTDINSCPNFNYMKDGYKIVGDFLLREAKT